MIHLSTLLGKKILDINGREIGPLVDLIISPEGKFAEITAFITKINGERRKIPGHFAVKYDRQIHLHEPFAKIPILKEDENELSLVNNVLDRQIVDTEGLKVVRVNDIILSVKEDIFCVISVDVGFKGFLRRLGLEDFPLLKDMKEQILPWEFVAPLDLKSGKIQLNVPKVRLSKIHPADLADIMEDLSHRERAVIFRSIDENLAAKTLKESEPEIQQSVLKNLRPLKVAKIVQELRPEDAADIISEMPINTAHEIMKLLSPLNLKDIKEIMKYDKERAGGIMKTNYIAISENSTAEEIINYLRDSSPSSKEIYYIYVVSEDNILAGVLPLRGLIVAKPEEIAKSIMAKNVISVNVNAKKDHIANLISKYNLAALPVVNEKNQLVGVIRSDVILELAMPKHWKKRTMVKRKKPTNGKDKK